MRRLSMFEVKCFNEAFLMKVKLQLLDFNISYN